MTEFFKWLKNLFCSCFPWFNAGNDVNDPREADQLLIPDSEAATSSPPLSRSASSAALLEALDYVAPVELSEEESAQILSDARLPATTDEEKMAKNAFIDTLSQAKQQLAYNLIMSEVKQNINAINCDMTALAKTNPNAYQIQKSWNSIRRDFENGDSSERSILPSCTNLKEKLQITSERTLLDNIMNLFSLCKNMLNQAIIRRIPKLAEINRAKADYLDSVKKECEAAQAKHEKNCYGLYMAPVEQDKKDAPIVKHDSKSLRRSK